MPMVWSGRYEPLAIAGCNQRQPAAGGYGGAACTYHHVDQQVGVQRVVLDGANEEALGTRLDEHRHTVHAALQRVSAAVIVRRDCPTESLRARRNALHAAASTSAMHRGSAAGMILPQTEGKGGERWTGGGSEVSTELVITEAMPV